MNSPCVIKRLSSDLPGSVRRPNVAVFNTLNWSCSDLLSSSSIESFRRTISIIRSVKLRVSPCLEVCANLVIVQVPIPWLQVKLLRLLQYYPAPGKC